RVYFDVQLNTSGGLFGGPSKGFYLSAPDGTRLIPTFADDPPAFTLPQTGQYTILVDERDYGFFRELDATGAYRFAVFEVPATTHDSLTIGQPVSGTIATPGQEKAYTFTGSVGQRLALDVVSLPNFNLGLRLLRPDGTSFWPASLSDRDAF